MMICSIEESEDVNKASVEKVCLFFSELVIFFEVSEFEKDLVEVEIGVESIFEEGKIPFPFNSQYNSTSGNFSKTFKTKSKLGLFLPESRCEIVDLFTLI